MGNIGIGFLVDENGDGESASLTHSSTNNNIPTSHNPSINPRKHLCTLRHPIRPLHPK
ncbi:hypothetical protein T440DRAFT_466898 [Plenodomus tracheiphilus IPT5]|uniref:Uncharacterized protein n=1 Tax=Plenodomus tracheiphilus IPT5 TaxID=1408161 RepID=A0A6A7BAD7_9PLEO|nr:hypothetical protein T440DRAFT_466898 [Plenodomus tracheiphilus IPT5]